ncbi:MAG: extensin-like protein, partial [Pseudophaeobacter sp.]
MILRRRIKLWVAGLVLCCAAAPLLAFAPEVSLRPAHRPTTEASGQQTLLPQSTVAALVALEVGGAGVNPGMRPVTRPVSPQILAAAALPVDAVPSVLERSLVPSLRPDSIVEQALFKRRRLRK